MSVRRNTAAPNLRGLGHAIILNPTAREDYAPSGIDTVTGLAILKGNAQLTRIVTDRAVDERHIAGERILLPPTNVRRVNAWATCILNVTPR